MTFPNYLGKFDDGFFEPVDFYMISQPDEVDQIIAERYDKRLEAHEGEDISDLILDEFCVLASAEFFYEKVSDNSWSKFKAGTEPLTVFKVYQQYVGRFIELMTPSEFGIKDVVQHEKSYVYEAPKIPSYLVAQIDAFLHAVDKKYQTEGIVILTYDETYRNSDNPEDGWNFHIPEQSNTGAHCNYDKSDVIEALGVNENIVGTIHSHPGMPAYASQTDHNDQAGFDGLHITFGWKGDKKEYYAEVVRGENFYNINYKDVMDLENFHYYAIEIDGELVPIDMSQLQVIENEFDIPEDKLNEQVDKVKKATAHTTHHGTSTGYTGGGNPKALSGHQSRQSTHTFDIRDELPLVLPDRPIEFPKGNFPDPKGYFYFLRLDKSNLGRCPACEFSFGFFYEEVMDRRQCLGCGIYLLIGDETIIDASKARMDVGLSSLDEIIADSRAEEEVVIWDYKSESYSIVGDVKKVLC